MPLPTGGPWPPPQFAPAFERMHEWSAWYSGDPDELVRVYQTIGQQQINRPHVRPSQQRGGLVGTLARWFWGQPNTPGEKRTKLHIPIAGDLTSTSADLLFSEPITLDSDDTATKAQLETLAGDEFHSTLLESAELGAALSGVYVRAVWDRDVQPAGPWLSPVHADAAIPEWRYGRLAAVTFVQELVHEGQTVVRHLERHETGAIIHGVYEGTPFELGRRVPLTEHPETVGLADSITTNGDTIETGIDQLTAVYVANIRPTRRWRNLPACAPFGRSDLDGNEGLMDALDETWTSWMRDLRLAKGRIIAPDAFLQDRGPGRGAMFDPDREVYSALNMIPSTDGTPQLTLNQFAIRVDEHAKTAHELISRIISTAGYSPQTFGLAGDVAITATEVAAKERRSLVTRDKKIKYWRPQLAAIVQAQLKLGQVHFGWPVDPSSPPTIVWPDAVQQDQASIAQTLALLETAQAASTETKIKMLHPDWDDEQITTEVGRIRDEQGGTTADPLQMASHLAATGQLPGQADNQPTGG